MNTTEAPRQLRTTGLALACLLLAIHAAHAARGITTTGNMVFGRFVARSGGTVAVGASGVRTSSGSVILLASASAAASFVVDPPGKGKLMIVSLPDNGSVLMTNGASNMAVNHFLSNAPANGQLNTQSYVLTVGATLQVGNNQQPGNYVGSFPVIVEYQ